MNITNSSNYNSYINVYFKPKLFPKFCMDEQNLLSWQSQQRFDALEQKMSLKLYSKFGRDVKSFPLKQSQQKVHTLG